MLDLMKIDSSNIPRLRLELVEQLPQVGSKNIVYNFDYENKIFLDIDTSIYDYIINNEYKMFIGKGHYKLNKKVKTLVSAGRLKIDKKIVYIDNDSGHYNPSKKHLEDVIEYFRSIGILSNNFDYVNIDNRL